MSDYTPDRWMVLSIQTEREVIYTVFASWSSGGMMGTDSWKLNSGITRAVLSDNYWEFDGSSGSVYRCHKDYYGTNGYGQAVLNNLLSQARTQGIKIEILDRDTDWASLPYDPLAQWIASGVKQ